MFEKITALGWVAKMKYIRFLFQIFQFELQNLSGGEDNLFGKTVCKNCKKPYDTRSKFMNYTTD